MPHLRLASPTCLPVWGSSPPSRPPCGPGPLPQQALREGTVRLAPGRGGPDILRAVTGSARAHELRSAWPRGHRARLLLAARLWLVLGPRLEETLGRRQPARAQTSVQMPPRKQPPLLALPERAGTVRGASVDDPRRFSGSASGDRCGPTRLACAGVGREPGPAQRPDRGGPISPRSPCAPTGAVSHRSARDIIFIFILFSG